MPNPTIPFKGGAMPVSGDTKVDIKFRDGTMVFGVYAQDVIPWDWGQVRGGEQAKDITDYRLHEEPPAL